jgi:hypothetical protein
MSFPSVPFSKSSLEWRTFLDGQKRVCLKCGELKVPFAYIEKDGEKQYLCWDCYCEAEKC